MLDRFSVCRYAQDHANADSNGTLEAQDAAFQVNPAKSSMGLGWWILLHIFKYPIGTVYRLAKQLAPPHLGSTKFQFCRQPKVCAHIQ